MDTARGFEVRQLLKAYRKGLVSDDLFAEQMEDIFGAGNGKVFAYNGRTYASERKMLLPLLDGYRAAEALGAESLQTWIASCQLPCLRGGLRSICEREAYHARLLEQRLTEIGGECRAQIPEAERHRALAALGSREVSDLQKLQGVVQRLTGPRDGAAELRRAVEQIEEDLETKEMLLTILDDEAASARWLCGTCEILSGGQRAAGASPTSAEGVQAASPPAPAPQSSPRGRGRRSVEC